MGAGAVHWIAPSSSAVASTVVAVNPAAPSRAGGNWPAYSLPDLPTSAHIVSENLNMREKLVVSADSIWHTNEGYLALGSDGWNQYLRSKLL